MAISLCKVQKNFSRAAMDYDLRAQFQHVQTRRVLDAALMAFGHHARIADIGCGTGYFAAAAQHQRPDWQITGIDIAPGMCAIANTRCAAIVGDAAHLPLADCSVDAAVSSLCYQWIDNQPQAFAELARVLKPGGRAVIATLGATTLHELRDASRVADLPLALLPMRTMHETKQALIGASLELSLADQRCVTEHYPTVLALVDSMRRIGAGNNFDGAARAPISPRRWSTVTRQYELRRTADGLPATWEHHFFVLHKPS